MSDKKTLGVFFGSRSCEHDVSIISALQLIRNVDRAKYDVVPVYITHEGVWYTGSKLEKIETYRNFDPYDKELTRVWLDMARNSGALLCRVNKGFFGGEREEVVARIDCAIPVFHGLHGEDGTLQGLFELCDIPYTSPGVCASAVGMDKAAMKQYFKGCGFPVLPGIVAERNAYEQDKDGYIEELIGKMALPVFVKPACLGSSIGVSRARDKAQMKESLEVAFSFDRKVLIEQALDSPIEVNCSVIGYGSRAKASVLEMPNVGSADFLDYNEKYMEGSKGMAGLKRQIPAPIGEEKTHALKELSLKVFRELDCKGVVRIDYMLDRHSDRYYITEINTIPGSMAYYLWEASGVKYSELIDQMVDIAMQALEDKRRNDYAFKSDILKQASFSGSKKTGKL